MLVSKITYGFVVQTFDTETNKWVSQQFIATNDDTEFEDIETGKVTEPIDSKHYLNFNMVQPSEAYPDAEF